MSLYLFSYNQHWGFHFVDNKIKLKELTIYNYDTHLKEKKNIQLIKDMMLADLLKNDFYLV